MGVAFKNQGKLDEAIEAYRKSISLKPNDAEAYSNLGVAFKNQGKLDEAIKAYKKAVSLKPDHAEAYNNLGNTLKEQGKLDKALENYNKAISLKPDYAESYNNIGLILHYLDKSYEAVKTFNKSISLKPDFAEAHYNLSFTLLNSGRLKEGLDESEWRWKTPKFLSMQRHFSKPMWDGIQSLKDKRILLWCEQGIGDTLNWSSCLSLLASQAKHCILECQDKLVPLLQRSFPNVEVKPEDRSLDKNRDDFDYHLPMGSLYRHFLSDITQNTKPKAYLVPDPDRVNYWRDRLTSLGKGPYVGIGWKSTDMSPGRLPNYAPILEWSPILKIPDVTFINLQYKDFEDDLAKVKEELGVTVHNFDDLDQFNNVDDTTALCAALDMLVSNHGTAPLISGGVGTLTKLANWKQSTWNTILYNPVGPSIDIFERNTWEPWDNIFNLIKEDIFKQINN
jgi:lipoprotein NlpI